VSEPQTIAIAFSDANNYRERFWAAVYFELFITTDRALKSGLEQGEALASGFEDLFRRIDFEAMDLIASADYQTKVDLDGLKYVAIALAFGNFLAQRGGIFLNEVPIEQ